MIAASDKVVLLADATGSALQEAGVEVAVVGVRGRVQT
jgi:hypothetical protein